MISIYAIRKMILEEIAALGEADVDKLKKSKKDNPEKEKLDKEKQALDQQKQDFATKKFDFQKQQAADANRNSGQQDKEKDNKNGGEETSPNISFKTQGDFYKSSLPELRNLTLSNGDLLDDDEKHYVALAIENSHGRFDKGFKRFLSKGRAGNVYGKDFSKQDIIKILKFVKENELVR